MDKKEYIEKYYVLRSLTADHHPWSAYEDSYEIVQNAPAADVAEVKHGEWVEDGYCDVPCVCSNCGEEAHYTSKFNETFDYDWEENLQPTGYEEIREYIKSPYCPHCGAKMDGKKGGEADA